VKGPSYLVDPASSHMLVSTNKNLLGHESTMRGTLAFPIKESDTIQLRGHPNRIPPFVPREAVLLSNPFQRWKKRAR